MVILFSMCSLQSKNYWIYISHVAEKMLDFQLQIHKKNLDHNAK